MMLHDIRWTSQKIHKYLELIEPRVYQSSIPLGPFRYFELDSPSIGSLLAPEIDVSDWQKISKNSYWGGLDGYFLLRTMFRIPTNWNRTALFLPIGIAGDSSHPEALVYINSSPYGAVDRHHQEVILPEAMSRDDLCVLTLHGWMGSFSHGQSPPILMGECCLVEINQPVRDFISLARVALGIADRLDDSDPIRGQLLTALNQAFNLLDTQEPLDNKFYSSVPESFDSLRGNCKILGLPQQTQIIAAGHAHLDIAWLWTIAQARQKAGRTFYNAIRLMERYPEFIFSQSQPQLYEFVHQDYPALFEHIRERVKSGQWEPLGGMWVEADCNISGGEALIRQLSLGRSFFQQHFGNDAESHVLWLPDVFGFPWSLPQLIKDAGLEYFFTIKLGWSQYNRLPYDSFWWQGIDGTRILTHFSTTRGVEDTFVSTYNATATPDEVITTWRNFQQKDIGVPGQIPPLLMVYGYGDGGGGPTREMVENLLEMKNFPGIPKVRMGKVSEYFKELRDCVGSKLPIWNDELYLEYHRGTYTSQARNKRANRKSEVLLHNLEFAASLASLLDPDFMYPRDAINQAWKLVCLNQFHDILSGTSIQEVYEESQAQYKEIARIGEEIQKDSLELISSYSNGDVLVVNPTSFSRNDFVFLEKEIPKGSGIVHSDGSLVAYQKVDGGNLLDLGELDPYSVNSLVIKASQESGSRVNKYNSVLSADDYSLGNKYLSVSFDDNGNIISIFDKLLGREILPPGETANQFQAFEDRPKTPDAWEIDISYEDKMWLAEPVHSMRLLEKGPLRATIELRRKILNSTIEQKISLDHNSRQLVFDTLVDWQERFILLKVAFPVLVLSPMATYEIQWGDIQRPTHRNTSWDWAKFEVPAQKWVDLSEGGYGISLLNDCKYGYDVEDNVIRLTLLRSPSYPDSSADRGIHKFIYSLLPHGKNWRSETIPAAYALNYPLITYVPGNGRVNKGRDKIELDSVIQTNQPNVVVETVKEAEDGNGLIVRVFESHRIRCECELILGFELSHAFRVDILENEIEGITVKNNKITFDINPYQILTFRLVPV